jgi:hypothetical protein
METQRVQEPLTKEYLDRYDLDSPVTEPFAVDAYDAGTELTVAAKAADEAGELDQAFVYRLLNTIAHLHFRPDERLEPYGPMATFANGSRTPQGGDFTRDQCEALFASRDRLRSVLLRAYIADLTWLNNRTNAEAARIAIDSFAELARRSLDGEAHAKHVGLEAGNNLVAGLLNRAITLAFAIGWDRPENDGLRKCLLSFYEGAKEQKGPNFSRAAELVLRSRCLDPQSVYEDAMRLGEEAQADGNFNEAEWAWARANNAALEAKNQEKARTAKLALSEAFESKADLTPDGFLKTRALEQAIEGGN